MEDKSEVLEAVLKETVDLVMDLSTLCKNCLHWFVVFDDFELFVCAGKYTH